MFEYSVGLIGGYALAKYLTPRLPRLKTKKYHLHHWIWCSIVLVGTYYVGAPDLVYGGLTGAVLQGLSYKNWSIMATYK